MRGGYVALLAAVLASLFATTAPARADSATIQLRHGFYQLETGLGSVWALNADEYVYSTLYRIDPVTETVRATIPLDFPASSLAVGFGSVWVTDYFGNSVHRFSQRGRVQAVIPVGQGPEAVHVAFGSVWTGNHHGHSLTRIDPDTDGVLATVGVCAHMFRDGVSDFTIDASYLYVACANLTRLERVDPATNSTTPLVDIGFIPAGPVQWMPGPLGGTIWDEVRRSLVGFDVLGAKRLMVRVADGHVARGLDRAGPRLCFVDTTDGDASDSTLRCLDPTTGADAVDVALPVRADIIRAGYGYVWAIGVSGELTRAQVDAGA